MKNYKSVPNRKTFKTKQHKAGTFTTVPNKLINDPNLTPKAKILLIQLLSDSDEFTVSPTLYSHRSNMSVSSVYNGFDELEEKGYLKRKPINQDVAIKGLKKKGSDKLLYHYTISEFGNLNNDDAKMNDEPIENSEVGTPSKEQLDNIRELISSNEFVMEASTLIENEGIENFQTNINHFNLLVERLDRKTEEVQKGYMKKVKQSLKNYEGDTYPKSVRDKMNQRIKQVVFTERRKFKGAEFAGSNDEAQKHWSEITRKYNSKEREKNTDYETLSYDRAEEEYYDNL